MSKSLEYDLLMMKQLGTQIPWKIIALLELSTPFRDASL